MNWAPPAKSYRVHRQNARRLCGTIATPRRWRTRVASGRRITLSNSHLTCCSGGYAGLGQQHGGESWRAAGEQLGGPASPHGREHGEHTQGRGHREAADRSMEREEDKRGDEGRDVYPIPGSLLVAARIGSWASCHADLLFDTLERPRSRPPPPDREYAARDTRQRHRDG